MSNTYGVNGSNAVGYPTTGVDAGVTTLSTDALLEYCQMRLGDLDGQITTQMNAQKSALREREAVQSAQSVLGRFGTAGPQSATDMQQCVTAINTAIAQLPSNDPVAGQLATFRDQMCSTYKFTPPRSLTADETRQLLSAESASAASLNAYGTAPYQGTIDHLNQLQTTGFLDKKPDKDAKEWQGTTDALGNIAADIKSNAEIQMLQLQDLVSQRQQAVQLASGMMSKEDQTLEAQAKAIGQ